MKCVSYALPVTARENPRGDDVASLHIVRRPPRPSAAESAGLCRVGSAIEGLLAGWGGSVPRRTRFILALGSPWAAGLPNVNDRRFYNCIADYWSHPSDGEEKKGHAIYRYNLRLYKEKYNLQLGLLALGQQVRHQQVSQVRRRLVEIVAHPLGSKALADNVEVEAVAVVSN